jgi:uncharacterized protein
MRSLIVGIDPGTETGIVILDLQGSVVHISSQRSAGANEVIRTLTKFGRPLVIAVDVSHVPGMVEKIVSSTGAGLFVPERSFSTKEKHFIVKEFVKDYKRIAGIELHFSSKHERDALAAAVKAWRSIRQLIKKVDQTLTKENADHCLDDVLQMIVRQESKNIAGALEKILSRADRK